MGWHANWPVILAVLAGLAGAEPARADLARRAPTLSSPWREPVGLWLSPDERYLAVVQRKGAAVDLLEFDAEGTLSLASHRRLGGQPESIAGCAAGVLVVPDSREDVAHVLEVQGRELHCRRSIGVGSEPVRAAIDPEGKIGWLSLRRGRAIESFDLRSGARIFRTELDFAPYCLALAPDETVLVVTDAAGGKLACLDPRTGRIRAAASVPGTNIRGLAFCSEGREVFLAHQIISERSMVTRDSIFWGALVTNNLRRIPLASLFGGDPLIGDWTTLEYVGETRRGAGDPGELALTTEGTAVVCLAGVDEIGVRAPDDYTIQRVRVGVRPRALVLNASQSRVLVANSGDDTLSEIRLADPTRPRTLRPWPAPTLSARDRGELLFSSARLSLDGWFSCHSCHTDGHTNGANADTDGDGNFGAPKNTPSLLGVGSTGPWGWTGRFERLEDQIQNSIATTLSGGFPSKEEVADLATYLRSLQPIERSAPRALANEDRVARGRDVFLERGCQECHAGSSLTSVGVRDVGLDDGLGGHRAFNPPSLRGAAHSAPYLHDGRARSLAAVFSEHEHQLDRPLADEELADLVAFLQSL